MYKNSTLFDSAEEKIMGLFLDLKKHYFSEISKKTGLSRPRTLRALRKLAAAGILEVSAEANVKFYSFTKKPLTYVAAAMIEYSKSLDFLDKNKTLKRSLEMFRAEYMDYLIMIIFGSYAKGHATKTSDIDLLLIKDGFTKEDVKKVEELFGIINGRTGLKISPYLMSMVEFDQKKAFVKEIIENHIILEGAEVFFKKAVSG